MAHNDPRKRILYFQLALTACALLFLASLYGPVMILHPGFGDHTQLLQYLYPTATAAREITLVGGIVSLSQKGTMGLAVLLTVFSILLPLFKFLVCASGLDALQKKRQPSLLVKVVHTFGFFSMAEVVVIALLAVMMKALPGGTSTEPGWAIGTYTLSVLGCSVITWWIHRMATEADPNLSENP